MSCFWDSLTACKPICTGLGLKHTSPNTVVMQTVIFAAHSSNMEDITCQDQPLSEAQIVEAQDWISRLSVNNIRKGYDCSTCDPVLCLVCQLCKVNITHVYNGHHIYYKNKHASQTVQFRSDAGHFWS